MSANAELIATARLRAKKYVDGSEAYMLNRLVAAIESAEAERDAALAISMKVSWLTKAEALTETAARFEREGLLSASLPRLRAHAAEYAAKAIQ